MRRKLLLTLAIVLLLCVSSSAQDVSGMMTTGIGWTQEGTIVTTGGLAVPIALSTKTFLIPGAGAGLEKSEIVDYGVNTQLGTAITSRFMLRVGAEYLRTDDPADKDGDVQAGIFILGGDFYFSDMFTDQNELIGLSATVTYNEQTQNVGVFAGLNFWFGKDNR